MRASGKGGGDGDGSVTPSHGTGSSFFNFGERAAQSQKAKMLAKLNTPHKRFEKKVLCCISWRVCCVSRVCVRVVGMFLAEGVGSAARAEPAGR